MIVPVIFIIGDILLMSSFLLLTHFQNPAKASAAMPCTTWRIRHS